MLRRSPTWVNTAVLLQAIERYEQGLLPRSMQLWIQAVLEIEQPGSTPLRPGCCAPKPAAQDP
jgi:hypothetical protein